MATINQCPELLTSTHSQSCCQELLCHPVEKGQSVFVPTISKLGTAVAGANCVQPGWLMICFLVICNVVFRCEHLVTQVTDIAIAKVHCQVITYWRVFLIKPTTSTDNIISLLKLANTLLIPKLTWNKFTLNEFTTAAESLFLNKGDLFLFFNIWDKYFNHIKYKKIGTICLASRPLLAGCCVATDCDGGCHEGRTTN